MRPIGFRGIRKDNGKWATGHLYEKAAPLQSIGEQEKQEKGEFYIIFAGFTDWGMPRPMYEVEVIPDTIGQFTGHEDKNAKQIYKGDVLECVEYNGDITRYLVDYDMDWGFTFKSLEYSDKETNQFDLAWNMIFSEVTIIGNICDNPELLHLVTV